MAFNGVFVDTNVLIYHTFALFDVDKHKAVKQQFEDFEQSSRVSNSWLKTYTNLTKYNYFRQVFCYDLSK